VGSIFQIDKNNNRIDIWVKISEIIIAGEGDLSALVSGQGFKRNLKMD
jgi:hypothetical protein